MWKKYLTVPAIAVSLLMGVGIPLAFEAGLRESEVEQAVVQAGRLPLLLPVEIVGNPLIYLLLMALLIFCCAKVSTDTVKGLRISLGLCLGAVAVSYALAMWGARTYYGMAMVYLAAIYLVNGSMLVPIVTVGWIACAVLLITRLRRTVPPKKPWE